MTRGESSHGRAGQRVRPARVGRACSLHVTRYERPRQRTTIRADRVHEDGRRRRRWTRLRNQARQTCPGYRAQGHPRGIGGGHPRGPRLPERGAPDRDKRPLERARRGRGGPAQRGRNVGSGPSSAAAASRKTDEGLRRREISPWRPDDEVRARINAAEVVRGEGKLRKVVRSRAEDNAHGTQKATSRRASCAGGLARAMTCWTPWVSSMRAIAPRSSHVRAERRPGRRLGGGSGRCSGKVGGASRRAGAFGRNVGRGSSVPKQVRRNSRRPEITCWAHPTMAICERSSRDRRPCRLLRDLLADHAAATRSPRLLSLAHLALHSHARHRGVARQPLRAGRQQLRTLVSSSCAANRRMTNQVDGRSAEVEAMHAVRASHIRSLIALTRSHSSWHIISFMVYECFGSRGHRERR
jgi:hypothetical protein